MSIQFLYRSTLTFPIIGVILPSTGAAYQSNVRNTLEYLKIPMSINMVARNQIIGRPEEIILQFQKTLVEKDSALTSQRLISARSKISIQNSRRNFCRSRSTTIRYNPVGHY